MLRQSTSTCFGHICSPSSGGVLYISNKLYALHFQLAVCRPACQPASRQASQQTVQHIPIHHLHGSFMELEQLLTRSGLTYPEISSKVYHDSFCQLESSISLNWVIYFQSLYLHVISSFSCIPVICPKFVLFLTSLRFVHLFCNMYRVVPVVIYIYIHTYTYIYIYIHSKLPDDGLQICPKHIEVVDEINCG